MALPVNYPDFERAVCAHLPDISTASSAFVAAPVRGRIVRVYSTIYNAVTGADAVWTMKINGAAVGGVSVTVANAGSAAGDVDAAIPSGANFVNEGDTIEFVSDGASTTTCPTTFVAVIREQS